MKRQYLNFNGTYFIMLNMNYDIIPVSVNSNIQLQKGYSYQGQSYISQKTAGGKNYKYDYVNDVIAKETVSQSNIE